MTIDVSKLLAALQTEAERTQSIGYERGDAGDLAGDEHWAGYASGVRWAMRMVRREAVRGMACGAEDAGPAGGPGEAAGEADKSGGPAGGPGKTETSDPAGWIMDGSGDISAGGPTAGSDANPGPSIIRPRRRELAKVLDRMIALIPDEEISLHVDLARIRENCIWKPPEDTRLWREVAGVMLDQFGPEPGPDELSQPWVANMLRIWGGADTQESDYINL
jgi:hypothetical protein